MICIMFYIMRFFFIFRTQRYKDFSEYPEIVRNV